MLARIARPVEEPGLRGDEEQAPRGDQRQRDERAGPMREAAELPGSEVRSARTRS